MMKLFRCLTVKPVLFVIWIYRKFISPLKPQCCRFSPTCSAYAACAINRFGIFRGGWLAIKRICRCQPLYKGSSLDPVPEDKSLRQSNNE